MPDRVVYLVTRVTKAMQSAELEFVDDAGLARLLAQGFETSTTLQDRKVRVDGKSVTATMMVLKPATENRGMTIGGGARPANQVRVQDEFGGEQTMDATGAIAHVMQRLERGLSTLGGTSHLGGAGDRVLPGMRIISAERVGQARDLGANAAMQGLDVSACPFPIGSDPYQLWMAGYRGARAAPTAQPGAYDSERAYQQGFEVARSFASDDVVSCPYAANNPLRRFWIDGFRAGGGRVEG